MLMIHDPSSWVIGTAADLRKDADVLEKIKLGLISSYRSKTNLDDTVISEMMIEETWFTAQEAIDKGFADVMLEPVQAQANLTSLEKFKYKNIPDNLLNKFSGKSFIPATNADKKPNLSPEPNLLILDANSRAQVEDPQQESPSTVDFNPLVADAQRRAKQL